MLRFPLLLPHGSGRRHRPAGSELLWTRQTEQNTVERRGYLRHAAALAQWPQSVNRRWGRHEQYLVEATDACQQHPHAWRWPTRSDVDSHERVWDADAAKSSHWSWAIWQSRHPWQQRIRWGTQHPDTSEPSRTAAHAGASSSSAGSGSLAGTMSAAAAAPAAASTAASQQEGAPGKGESGGKSHKCDKCDGNHPTDSCPWFKKPRDKHPDAKPASEEDARHAVWPRRGAASERSACDSTAGRRLVPLPLARTAWAMARRPRSSGARSPNSSRPTRRSTSPTRHSRTGSFGTAARPYSSIAARWRPALTGAVASRWRPSLTSSTSMCSSTRAAAVATNASRCVCARDGRISIALSLGKRSRPPSPFPRALCRGSMQMPLCSFALVPLSSTTADV